MNSLDNLILASERHSIKEAVITFFLANKIFNPKKFSSLMETEFKGTFQQFELVNKLQIKVVPNSPDIREIENVGFNFVKFEEGRKSYIIQGINEENRTFYSFHALKYTNWKEFISTVQKYVMNLLKIQKGSYIMAYSLNYTDEFYWNDINHFDAKLILKNSKYIPQNVLDASVLDYNLNLDKKNQENGYNYFDRIAIKFQNKMTQKVISIGHNITFVTDTDPIPLDDAVGDGSDVLKQLKFAHDCNKSFLKDTLTEEVIKRINL